MNLFESMSLFITVIENGSLSAGARQLGVPLNTVSRKISELETYLGVRLLNRSTRRIELTDSGKNYLASCKRIIDDIATIERTVKGEYAEPKGDLIVTSPVVFGRLHILPLVVDFLRSYPKISIQLILTDQIINLIEKHVDIAIRIGELSDSTMIGKKVGLVRRVACASPAYLTTNSIPKKPEDLLLHSCISIDTLVSRNVWNFYDKKKKLSVQICPRLTVSNVDAGIEAAILGTGITCALSYQIEKSVREGKLKIILENYEPSAKPVHIIHSNTNVLPLKTRLFMDFIGSSLKKQLPQ